SGNTPRLEAKDGTLTVRGADWIARRLEGRDRFEVAFELPADSAQDLSLWLVPLTALQRWLHALSQVDSPRMPGTVQIQLAKKSLVCRIGPNPQDSLRLPLPVDAQAEAAPAAYRLLYDGRGRHILVLRNGSQIADLPIPGQPDRRSAWAELP